MYQFSKSSNVKSIKTIPFESLITSGQKKWVKDNNIKDNISWILPQLYTLLGGFTLPRDSEGKIDGKRFWSENLDMSELRNQGIYMFFQIDPRGDLIKIQNRPEYRQYSTLVPLVLSAIKIHKDVPYSDWSRTTLHHVVPKTLCEAMLGGSIAEFTDLVCDKICVMAEAEQENFGSSTTLDEILNGQGPDNNSVLQELRTKGLEIKSGDRIGQSHNPITNHFLNATGNNDFDNMPKLWRIMATQIWLAHPLNRSSQMVLDPNNWDSVPENIISTDIVYDGDSKYGEMDLPWDAD